jgi:hypothetical protein
MSESTVSAQNYFNIDAMPRTEWWQAGLRIIIACNRNDLKLGPFNHFARGKLVRRMKADKRQYDDAISIAYVSESIVKGLKGILICQVQGKLGLPEDMFVVVLWNNSFFEEPKAYIFLAKSKRGNFKWSEELAKKIV